MEVTLKQIECQFKVIALTETWLNSNTLPPTCSMDTRLLDQNVT